MGFFGKSKGRRCDPLPDGSGVTCQVYENGKNEKKATGTQITIRASPETGCEPVFDGSFDISDEDEADVQKIAKQVKQACHRGLV